MNTLHFYNYEDFAIDVADRYDEVKKTDGFDSIDIIAKYEDAKEIIRELIAVGYGIAFIDNFGDPEWDGYEDEFIISLYDDEVWCEAAKRDCKYITSEAKVVYLLDNCSSKIIPFIESDEVYEVEICDCEYDCDDCELFDTSPASYTVNDKKVSKDEYENKLAEIEKKYDDVVRNVLLDYCEIADEMNEWRKLLGW